MPDSFYNLRQVYVFRGLCPHPCVREVGTEVTDGVRIPIHRADDSRTGQIGTPTAPTGTAEQVKGLQFL